MRQGYRPRGRMARGLLLLLATVAGGACTTEPRSEAAPPADADRMDRSDAVLVDVTGRAPPPADGAPAVVILRSDEPSDVPVPTEPAVMDQFGRDFIPRLLLVRLGQPVLFKNSEDDLHTVHVSDEDGRSLFNVAMPIRGGRYGHFFDEAGDYAVSCDAHQEMSATILVLTTPYAAIADRDGRFTIPRVAEGEYTVVLRQGGKRHESPVEIVPGGPALNLIFPSPA